MHIENTILTLNASESSNPNEKDVKKYLLYTWQCNILKDNNCKKITTTGTILYVYLLLFRLFVKVTKVKSVHNID